MSQSQDVKYNFYKSKDESDSHILVASLEDKNLVFEIEKNGNVFQLTPPNNEGVCKKISIEEKIKEKTKTESIEEAIVHLSPPSSPSPQPFEEPNCSYPSSPVPFQHDTQMLIIDEDKTDETMETEMGKSEADKTEADKINTDKTEKDKTKTNETEMDKTETDKNTDVEKTDEENAKIRYNEFHKYLQQIFTAFLESKK